MRERHVYSDIKEYDRSFPILSSHHMAVLPSQSSLSVGASFELEYLLKGCAA